MRRSVHFNVDASGKVDKRIPQFGGVRGEHHATEIVFTMAATAPYQEGDLVRLRFMCGDGAVLSSDLVEDAIVQGERMLVSYSLPSVLTQAGGQLGVRVVFSRVDESGRETETFLTDEAVLYFEDTASENGTPFWTGVSEMLRRTATASDAAVAARDAAIAQKHETQASAESASRFADAAEERALEAVSAEKNAQLYASAALSARDDAENARMQTLTASNAAARSVGIAKEAASTAESAASKAEAAKEQIVQEGGRIDRLENDFETTQAMTVKLMGEKLSKSGHEPNKYLGTDENGNVTEKNAPEGGGATDEQVRAAVDVYLAENPVAGVEIQQTTGDSKTAVMSQAAVSAEIDRVDILKRDTSAWQPVDELDGATWDAEGTYWSSSGNKTTTALKYKATEELIAASPNCDYHTVGFIGVIRIYDANKVLIEDKSNTAMSNQLTFTTSEHAAYFGIAYRYDALATEALVANIQLIRNTMTAEDHNVLPMKSDVLKPLYGKTVVCFGDSLFGMYRGETSAPAYIQRVTGATVHNVGFGGCRMAAHPTSGYAAFSMWKLADAVASGDWTEQDAQAASGSSYFPEQLALLKSIDFNTVDAVVIHYGTNDFMGSVAIGESSTETTTVCGALRHSIEALLSTYPHLRVYVSLPVFRFWTDGDTVTYSDAYTNGNGDTLVELVCAMQAVAREYNLPSMDGYHGLGINQQNATAFLSDGVHHNEAGRARFGTFLGNKIAYESNDVRGLDSTEVRDMIAAAIGEAIGGAY